jgi:uncharacterized protein (TIGR03000 family)
MNCRSIVGGGLALFAMLVVNSALLSQDGKAQPARLKLMVPKDAVVEIEGVKTTQTGEVRNFVSPALVPGKNYSYTVKATWKDAEGKDVVKEEVVKVQPGQEAQVDLRPPVAAVKTPPAGEKKEEKKTEPAKEEKKATENKDGDKKAPPEAKAVEKKEAVAKEQDKDRTPDVIFVPTPNGVVKRMLELVKVGKDDVVYDLGCGDGRIVVAAVKDFNAKKGIGYDIDPQRVKESLENVKKNKVEDRVTIEKKDIFTLDLSGANVITLYLLPSLNVKLMPQLEKMKPGSRIVSHDFNMEGAKPDHEEEYEAVDDNGNKRSHKIYVWTIPLKKTKQE